MFKKVMISTVVLYTLTHMISATASDDCMGWDCKEVYCPDGYAVEVEPGKFLPCEDFDKYIDTKEKELLK